MPEFAFNGTSFDLVGGPPQVDPVFLTFEYAQTPGAIRIVFDGPDGAVRFTRGLPDGLRIGSRDIADDASVTLSFQTWDWAASGKTGVIVVEDAQGANAFRAIFPVAGQVTQFFTALQDEHRYLETLDMLLSVAPTRTGDRSPGTNHAPNDFFDVDLFGSQWFGSEQGRRIEGTALGDVIAENGGADRVFGNDGNDTLMLGQGADIGYGGNGNDRVSGYQGSDVLFGGNGRDVLFGGQGDDRLLGGGGGDTFVLRRGWGDDRVDGFSAADKLLFDRLWAGDLTAGQVVRRFADVVDGDVLFDFGDRGSLRLEGLTSTHGLAAQILI